MDVDICDTPEEYYDCDLYHRRANAKKYRRNAKRNNRERKKRERTKKRAEKAKEQKRQARKKLRDSKLGTQIFKYHGRVLRELEEKETSKIVDAFIEYVDSGLIQPQAILAAQKRDFELFRFLALFNPGLPFVLNQAKYYPDAVELRKIGLRVKGAFMKKISDHHSPEEIVIGMLSGEMIIDTGESYLPSVWTTSLIDDRPDWTPLRLTQRFFGYSTEMELVDAIARGSSRSN